jgi:hypothetical protein
VSQDTPKLHGWITPEYAVELVQELIPFILEHKPELYNDKYGLFGPIKLKCQSTTINAPNAI